MGGSSGSSNGPGGGYQAGYDAYQTGSDPYQGMGGSNYNEGWMYAAQNAQNTKQEDDVSSLLSSMMEGFHSGAAETSHHAASEYDPTEDYLTNIDTTFAHLNEYVGTAGNPDAVYETLTEYNGKSYGWDTVNNSWAERDTPGQFIYNADTGTWDSYESPSGGYGWTGSQWEASGSNLDNYSRIYNSSGDMYERSTFDDMMGGRMDAANAAVDYVNQQIEDERSNANLLGVQYEVDPGQKSQRVNDYFASMWSEGDESKLSALAKVWGVDLDLSGVTRGNADNADTGKSGTTLVTRSKPIPGSSTAEDTTLGGQNTLLGGA